MDVKTKYQMGMLAGAKKGGEVVYPGLKTICPGETHECCYEDCGEGWGCENGLRRLSWLSRRSKCTNCNGTGFILNPDLGSLIEAAQGQGLAVNFVVPGGVELRKGHWNSAADYTSRGPDNLSALIDALFQAVEAQEPDNWKQCEHGRLFEGDEEETHTEGACRCNGTGEVERPNDA